MSDKLFFTVAEVAEALGLHPDTVRARCAEGKFQFSGTDEPVSAFKDGSGETAAWRFPAGWHEAYARARTRRKERGQE